MTEMTAKDYAKIGFDEFLQSSDKEFPFEFDDIWLFLEQKRAKESWREKVTVFEDELRETEEALGENMLNVIMPVEHRFTEKQYIREFRAPAGHTVVSKIHNTNHPIFLLEGEVTIIEESGKKRVKAPYYSITEVGTKRVVIVHEDCFFVTVHPSEKTNIFDVEEEVIAKSFKDVNIEPKNSSSIDGFIEQVRNVI
jgi:quercetin dioxygenase-like cupin family protein